MTNYLEYFDEKIHQLRTLANTQWDYLRYSHVCDWLEDNFSNDDEGKYYALKILLHTIYYSKKDIEILIEYGLYEKIYGEKIKSELIANNNVHIYTADAIARVNSLKSLTFFIPILDHDKPSESGNTMIGELVHKLGVSTEQVDFHWNVNEGILNKYKILIFIDDCVGSGTQLKNFWNSYKTKTIRELCKKYAISIYYLVVVGYDKSLIKLKESKEIEDINVIVCDILTDKNRIFAEENIIWDKENNERENVINYFENIRRTKGVSFLGFKKLDFAVILHDRLPNWSLPIFWKEIGGWKCLLRRKTS